MDFKGVIRSRRVFRDFLDAPIPEGAVERVIDSGRRAPSAGNTHGREFVLLEGADQTRRLWDVTLPPSARRSFAWPGLLSAPAVVLPVISPDAYLSRYGESDKAATGLGESRDAWPVPYWYVDGRWTVMAMLLAAGEEGLGVLFLGLVDR